MKEQRKLAAVMFTDIVGFTSLMSTDERKTLTILQRKRDILKPAIRKYNGEFLKEIGDGTLSCFYSAVEAVNYAMEIQQILIAGRIINTILNCNGKSMFLFCTTNLINFIY